MGDSLRFGGLGAALLCATLGIAGEVRAACPDTSPADGKCDSPAPGSLFGDPSGKNFHNPSKTIWTQDVGNSVTEIVEYSRLVDASGYTACDRYFGWRGLTANTSDEQKILCGKYMYFFEHWGAPGLPDPLGKMNKSYQRHELQGLKYGEINDGEQFVLSDGINKVTFEFNKDNSKSGFGNSSSKVEVDISWDWYTGDDWKKAFVDPVLQAIEDAVDSCDGVDKDDDCSGLFCNGYDDPCDARQLNIEVEGPRTNFNPLGWKQDLSDQNYVYLNREKGKEGKIILASETVANSKFRMVTPWMGVEMDVLGYEPNHFQRRIIRDVVSYGGKWYETGKACHPNRKTAAGECLQWCTSNKINDPILGLGCLQETANSNTSPLNPAAYPPTIQADQDTEDPGWPVGLNSSPKWDYEMYSSNFTCAACHTAQLQDGRYAIGMAKQNQNYGQLIHGVAGPLVTAIRPLMALMGGLTSFVNCGAVSGSTSLCDGNTSCGSQPSKYAADELDSNQTDISCLTDLLGNPLGNTVNGLVGTMLGLGLHREVEWNTRTTTEAWSGTGYENMIKDYSKGTCYYTQAGQLIMCGAESETRGTQWRRDRALQRRLQLQKLYVDTGITPNLVLRDWYQGAMLVGDDVYAVARGARPSLLSPAGSNSVKYCEWDFTWYQPYFTTDALRANCHGLRWDVEFYGEFLSGMTSMLGALFGVQGLPMLKMTQQDAYMRFDVGNLDFLDFPLLSDALNLSPEDYDINGDGVADCVDSDGDPNTVPAACAGAAPILSGREQVYTLSKYPSLFNLPSSAQALDYGMVEGDGSPTAILALDGAGRSGLVFATTFPIIANSVDPRWVECDEDGDGHYNDKGPGDSLIDVDGDGIMDQLEGRWDAKPWHIQGRCRAIEANFEPLAAYLEGLKAPAPAASVPLHKTSSTNVSNGRALFDQHCLSCHNGPSGETNRIFLFGDVNTGANCGGAGQPKCEGTATSIPTCASGVNPVTWDESSWPRTPVYNNCKPYYLDPSNPKYNESALFGGYVGTDPQYSRVFSPSPITGAAVYDPKNPLNKAGIISQGVKGSRLAGTRFNLNMLHHGRVKGARELLCMAGTARDPAACSGGNTYGCNYGRDYSECMYYDMDSKTKENNYYAGSGTCLQNLQPYRGHEFGCQLTTSQKEDLIAYLNTL